MTRTAFASFLLWTGALALLGFVALMCMIGAGFIGADQHPTFRAVRTAIQIGRMDPGPAQFCPTPMPVRPQQPKETKV
jgi:hypothetical protein